MGSREVKDSGIEWIAQVPKDWQLVRLKDGYNFEKGKNSSLYTKEYIGTHPGEYPVYSGQTENDGIMGSIDTYDYELDECLFTTTVGAKVMSPRVLKGRFSLSQNCLIMKSNGHMNNLFVYYTLYPLFDYQKSAIPSYMQPSLRVSDLNKYNFYVPSIQEQQKIAAFLDGKVAHINNIIEDTKKSIENLKAYKQSLITETVTKGIDPNVEMKDSGIEWIGDIPKHWNPIKLKYLVELRNEKKNYKKGDCYIGLENIESYKGRINSVQIDYNSGLTDFFKKGDVLFNKLRPYLAKGFIAEFDAFGSGELLVLTQYKGDKRFLLYYLLSSKFIDVINSSTYGAKMPRANWDFIKELSIISPTKEEQGKIADFLDEKSRTIDSTIEQKKQLVIELESYKKSLIYEYVTGKKEVK